MSQSKLSLFHPESFRQQQPIITRLPGFARLNKLNKVISLVLLLCFHPWVVSLSPPSQLTFLYSSFVTFLLPFTLPHLLLFCPYLVTSLPAADVMLVQPRVEFILSFIHHIAEDEDHSDGVVANAAGLIG